MQLLRRLGTVEQMALEQLHAESDKLVELMLLFDPLGHHGDPLRGAELDDRAHDRKVSVDPGVQRKAVDDGFVDLDLGHLADSADHRQGTVAESEIVDAETNSTCPKKIQRRKTGGQTVQRRFLGNLEKQRTRVKSSLGKMGPDDVGEACIHELLLDTVDVDDERRQVGVSTLLIPAGHVPGCLGQDHRAEFAEKSGRLGRRKELAGIEQTAARVFPSEPVRRVGSSPVRVGHGRRVC